MSKQGIHCFAMILVLCALLTGCQKNHSDMWYMQHPVELQKILVQCQSATDQMKIQNHCDRLMSIAQSLQAIIIDQQAHPEEFGQRIMQEQSKAVQLQQVMVQAETSLSTLKRNDASTTQSCAVQDDLYKAKKAFIEQEQQVNTLLAVVALSSPD